MHEEGHDSRREDIILHVGVPRSPHSLEDIEVDIVLGYLVELAPVSFGRRIEKGGRRIPMQS